MSAHGNTVAEIIYKRADAAEPFMGLTSFKGDKPTKQEACIAKNYLNEKELDIYPNSLAKTICIYRINS